jgi:phage terminase small subunit
LKNQARQKWLELAPHFDLRSPLDVEMLAQYCEAFELNCRAKKELDGDTIVHIAPNGAPYPHPGVNIMIKTSDQMRRLYKQLDALRKKDDADPDELEI